jgi:phage gp36-like protein
VPYCSVTDLQRAITLATLVQLTDDANTGVVDMDNAEWSINAAAGVIDSYISQVAALPLTGTPAAPLTAINVDLAVCRLFGRVQTELPEDWKDRCGRAIELLEKIADGRVNLFPVPADPSESRRMIKVSSRDKDFPPSVMEKY